MARHNYVGRVGEEIACEFLEANGYKILERNFRRPYGEIDIVSREMSGQTVFVEVKTVSRESSGRPEDNVHPEKLRKLGNTIQAYMAAHPRVEDWRFDVITVKLDLTSKKASIGHLKDIIIGA
ncbi:MAG: YraN family protein [Patescibacteria group bacterium]